MHRTPVTVTGRRHVEGKNGSHSATSSSAAVNAVMESELLRPRKAHGMARTHYRAAHGSVSFWKKQL
jgi:hypothetical protein